MNYVGEHLLPGQIGHLCAVLSFVAALLSTLAYFWATQRRGSAESDGWRSLGRFGFVLHGLATLAIIGTLFYILLAKMYEYQYAWANASDDLPSRYVFSAFWKEQQGSFLLWSFWHVVLGVVLLLRGGKWETPVMTVIALAETFIASMILGIYFGDWRMGASPFDLLRHAMDAPIFAQADYLSKIKGNGLNPLLQNYWMTIHPPTLFLGFASTVVPFAFAVAGLWLREHKDWLRPALPWALFSGAVLGTGILMGGAWAYEALSFAGYWAWDPVENTSLVPWLTLVAGIHAHLVARSTGYSLRMTYAMYLLSFLLVLYSTYLTRSGILGDTSAHAFTEMGLGFQLVLFMAVFSVLAVAVFLARQGGVPDVKKSVDSGPEGDGTRQEVKAEEGSSSREFWMFIGTLVLLFSAVLITGATSLPVVNKIFGTDYALTDPMAHHNRYQMWIAVFMGLLTGLAQFLRYNERNWAGYARKFWMHMGIAALAAAALTALNALWIKNLYAWQLYVLLFAGMFAVSANADYLLSVLRGNLRLAGSAISHLGFGVLLLGILSTGLGKDWISVNTFAMEGLIEGMGGDEMNRNVLLMKDAPMPIRDFTATYLRDTIERQTRTFAVQFQRRGPDGNPTGEQFTLHPNVMYDRQFSKVVASNPSTQHYWNYDIFTHVSSLPKAELDPEYAKQQEDSLKFERYTAIVGDTIFTATHALVVDSLTKTPKHPDYQAQAGDLAFGLKMRAYALNQPDQVYPAAPLVCLRPGKGAFALATHIGQLQTKVRLAEGSIEEVMRGEDALRYRTSTVAKGDAFQYEGYTIRFVDVAREVHHPNYAPQPDDLAVGAKLEITAPDGRSATATPIYLIRGNQQYSLKDEVPAMGLHLRFDRIDPAAGAFAIGVARADVTSLRIPIEVAENAARMDYIVLEAIVFPGINLVWVGSILMLLGLAIGLWRRLSAQG
ncbi:MAG TPA: cytochrome c biogenesis protein CcsA [Saprospiraceae bacterium]|nr:cytochrome c biogenesis protein CcsA [Saprospiraceae bacterium]